MLDKRDQTAIFKPYPSVLPDADGRYDIGFGDVVRLGHVEE